MGPPSARRDRRPRASPGPRSRRACRASARARRTASLPISPKTFTVASRARRPRRRRRRVALAPRDRRRATMGISVAWHGLARPRSAPRPVVFTGISRFGSAKSTSTVDGARVRVGGGGAPRDGARDRLAGRQHVDRQRPFLGPRASKSLSGTSNGHAHGAPVDDRDDGRPGPNEGAGIDGAGRDLAVEGRAQDAVADLERRGGELRPLRGELRLLGGALRRLLLRLVGRDEAAVEQRLQPRRLVSDGLLPCVDRARLGGDRLAGRAGVAAIERRQNLAPLHERAGRTSTVST